MTVSEALAAAENAIRDLVASVLAEKLGPTWVDECGVSKERLKQWGERKNVEVARQKFGVVDERLIYYADFYDLEPILKKHWSHFSDALGDQKTLLVFLAELGRLRDPDAHRRTLLPHQEALAIGISGEIRARIVRYRSKKDTMDDCFPRIEAVRDSLGNIWSPGGGNAVNTELTLRPGDVVDFVVTATDPQAQPLSYGLQLDGHGATSWNDTGRFEITIRPEHISRKLVVALYVKSPREYHAEKDHDGFVVFSYPVLPAK
jgi:hypothetical protein